MNRRNSPPLQSARLLDQVRERARYLHYSLSTEKECLYCVRAAVLLREVSIKLAADG